MEKGFGEIDETLLDRRTKRKEETPPSRLIISTLIVVAWFTIVAYQNSWFSLTRQLTIDSGPHRAYGKFDWRCLETKPYLDYTPCYGDFQCARLELPMDYWNDTTDATISLAIIKSPAPVPVTHSQYGGAILINPGGPGGSGVQFLALGGENFHDSIDSKDGKYFDFISFDPRGVGWSRPHAICFENHLINEAWDLRVSEEGFFGTSDAAYGRLWSMYQAYSKSCSLPPQDGCPDIKKYVTTASVARDMLEIVERHGEWREKEAKKLVRADGPNDAISSLPTLEGLEYRPGEEKINFFGFSYGTLLGNTFAAMYPERINRLAVDGVADAYDYTKMLWFDDLVDTEEVVDLLYYHCARVGYPTCPLANKTGPTTADSVKDRVKAIQDSLYHNPLPVVSATIPSVVTYSDVKALIFVACYAPIYVFPLVAEILAQLERGNGTLFSQLGFYDPIDCVIDSEDWPSVHQGEATMAIACTDGDDQSWMTKSEFRKFVDKIEELSPAIGEKWSEVRLSCIHYDIRPYARFEGPWVGNTSHPILEIGNAADPVCPGRNAVKMAEGFPGAGVLIQNSAGHCSNSAPSNCTETYIRRYFQTGELPPPFMVCEADALPFGPSPDDEEVLYDAEILEVTKRQSGIAKALHNAGGGFLPGRRAKALLNYL